MTKKLITDSKDLVHLDLDFEEDTLEELLKKTSEMIEEFGKDAYINKEHYGHDGAYDLYLYFERYETEQEYQERLEREYRQQMREAKLNRKYEEKERETYERLKKKFGDA